MRQRNLLLKAERHFSTAKNSSFNRFVSHGNALKDSLAKMILCNRRKVRFTQEVRVINIDDLKVASPPR